MCENLVSTDQRDQFFDLKYLFHVYIIPKLSFMHLILILSNSGLLHVHPRNTFIRVTFIPFSYLIPNT